MPTKARSCKCSSSWAIQLGQIHWGDGLTDLTGPTEELQVQSVSPVSPVRPCLQDVWPDCGPACPDWNCVRQAHPAEGSEAVPRGLLFHPSIPSQKDNAEERYNTPKVSGAQHHRGFPAMDNFSENFRSNDQNPWIGSRWGDVKERTFPGMICKPMQF